MCWYVTPTTRCSRLYIKQAATTPATTPKQKRREKAPARPKKSPPKLSKLLKSLASTKSPKSLWHTKAPNKHVTFYRLWPVCKWKVTSWTSSIFRAALVVITCNARVSLLAQELKLVFTTILESSAIWHWKILATDQKLLGILEDTRACSMSSIYVYIKKKLLHNVY